MRILALCWLVLLIAACGSTDGGGERSFFWDGSGDVRGVEALRIGGSTELSDIVSRADVVAVVSVPQIEGTLAGAPLIDIELKDPADKDRADRLSAGMANTPVITTYQATLETLVAGEANSTLSIETFGGVAADGTPSFEDGSFLLEPGRSYLLSLTDSGHGSFIFSGGRGNFDVTDGVKVLNHPETRDLESLEEMSVSDFVAYVDALAESEGKD